MKNTLPTTEENHKETAEIKRIPLHPDLMTYLQRNFQEIYKRYRLISEILDLIKPKNKHVPTEIINDMLRTNGITININEILKRLSVHKNGKFGKSPGFIYRAIFHRGTFEDFVANATIDFLFRHFKTSLKTPEIFKSRLINETTFVELKNSDILQDEIDAVPVSENEENPEITEIRTRTSLPAIHKAIYRTTGKKSSSSSTTHKAVVIPPPPDDFDDGSIDALDMINRSHQ